jgi:O-Antigen ligase
VTEAPPPPGAVDPSSPLEKAGPVFLIVGSALTAPLVVVFHLTLTGDRLLGLAALAVATALGLARRLRWTPVHSALAVFVGVQVVTSALNARAWPQGLKFMIVYALGLACFCLAAEWARGVDGQRRLVTAWIAVGAALGVIGTAVSVAANLSQQPVWGTGLVQELFLDSGRRRVFAGQATFVEWNLLSSFLLVPFALALWRWRPDDEGRQSWPRSAALAALVLGLVFGFTRAAWLSMGGLIAFWWWSRRPRRQELAALGSMLALAFLLQAAVVGASPLWFRMGNPLRDRNLLGRVTISRVTIASWRQRPIVGHGAGSVNQLSAILPGHNRIRKIWNGNFVLFVLNDSGLAGLAALLGLGVVVCGRAGRAIGSAANGASSSLAVPVLAAGAGLCLAYLFTHGLWLMYSYVYLGLLTAVTDPDRRAP